MYYVKLLPSTVISNVYFNTLDVPTISLRKSKLKLNLKNVYIYDH